jgi:hypothetical protein
MSELATLQLEKQQKVGLFSVFQIGALYVGQPLLYSMAADLLNKVHARPPASTAGTAMPINTSPLST